MYKIKYITENHLKVLNLFTRGFDKEIFIREAGRMAGISPRSAELILKELERKNVLRSRTRGKIRVFTLKMGFITREYLLMAEAYRCLRFLEENALVSEVLRKLLPSVQGAAAVFGSFAKGTQKKGSDLDLLVIGKYDRKRVKELSRTYGIEISVKHYPLDIYVRKVHKDILLKEVLDCHVIVKGKGIFLDGVSEWSG